MPGRAWDEGLGALGLVTRAGQRTQHLTWLPLVFTASGLRHEALAAWPGLAARRGTGVFTHVWFGPAVTRAAQAATMVKLLVAKILCMVGVFFFMLLGSLLPVKIIETDFEKAHRSKKILSLCNTFGGGVFLATCFNALLPAVRDKVRAPWAVVAHFGPGTPMLFQCSS